MQNPKASLKKNMFSHLQLTLEKTDSSGTHFPQAINNNLRSGFEATSIYPLNPNKILNKIPSTDDNSDQFESCVLFEGKMLQQCPVQNSSQKKNHSTEKGGKSVAVPTNASHKSEEMDNILEELSDENEDSNLADEVDYLATDPKDLVSGTFIQVNGLSGNTNLTVQYRSTDMLPRLIRK